MTRYEKDRKSESCFLGANHPYNSLDSSALLLKKSYMICPLRKVNSHSRVKAKMNRIELDELMVTLRATIKRHSLKKFALSAMKA